MRFKPVIAARKKIIFSPSLAFRCSLPPRPDKSRPKSCPHMVPRTALSPAIPLSPHETTTGATATLEAELALTDRANELASSILMPIIIGRTVI
jgi:hypothetical protein